MTATKTLLEGNVLSFAKGHDWGKDAYIKNDFIHGLKETLTRNGKIFKISECSVPATIKALRIFGDY